jgi:hypothetical protein
VILEVALSRDEAVPELVEPEEALAEWEPAQSPSKPRGADEDALFEHPVAPCLANGERDSDASSGLGLLLQHRPLSISPGGITRNALEAVGRERSERQRG